MSAASLTSLYRPVRAVGAPDSPFDGVLARGPDDRTVLLVDRDALGDWSGWSAAADEHVLSVLDVVRRSDGHDVVLPLLTERVDRFLARRLAAAVPPSDGELVTLGVSVLRGIAAAAGADAVQWWLDDGGRPVVVPGRGDGDAHRAGADVLRAATASSSGAVCGVLAEVADALGADRHRDRLLVEAENALFACAHPEPLATSVLAPLRDAPRPVSVDPAPTSPAGPRPWWRSLAGHLDADLADTVFDAAERVRRHLHRRAASRRAPVVLAVVGAVAVLSAGLLWPDGGDGATAGQADTPSAVPTPSSGAGDTQTPPAVDVDPPAPPVPAAGEPDRILAELLARRASCTDEACLAGVVENPTRALTAGAIDLPETERAIALVDDLGGLLVLRVAAHNATGASQIVTIVETPEGWRIRDAYAIADPPG